MFSISGFLHCVGTAGSDLGAEYNSGATFGPFVIL